MNSHNSIWLWLVLSATAAAQTPCGAPVGPDLIVAEIGGVVNYAASNGADAVMFGESTCNVGTAPIVHQLGPAAHPVHIQGLFRYETVAGSGRFEQVGTSWAFHDLSAVEQALCCTCMPVGNGDQGPGCSSVDTASAEATQSNLGKRYDVNAFTGNFVYPIPLPSGSSTFYRRLRFASGDLDPSVHAGASFFVECAVVASDDASAQNRDNNASYRSINVASVGGDASIALNGSTVRERPAIWAWQALDPQVHVEVVHAPNEGLFLVASRATDLGLGLWHYEYAVENVNSDDSCGALHVPLPLASLPLAIGFHDVEHPDNDGPNNMPVDGTDWTPTVGLSEITWSTVPWSTNPAGNGLRFGTLYTFRFDVLAPPQLSSVTLDTWKVPGSVTAQAWAPGSPVLPGVPFCFGDGSGTACPCGNFSPPGAQEGCLNSLGTGGRLVSIGLPSVSNDLLVLLGTQMTNASGLYFQGTTQVQGGAGLVFGDGLRCAGGTIARLATQMNVAHSSMYPEPGDPSVSVRGGCVAGDVRTYQVWYRNPASFCSPSTFNVTNGVQVTWFP